MQFDIRGYIKSSLLKNSIAYTVTDAICKGMSFLLLPLISYYIVPEELGIVANFDVFQNILSLIAGQAVVNALPYFYYERSREKMASIVSGLFFLILCTNVIMSFGIAVLSDVITRYLHLGIMLQLLTIAFTLSQMLHNINTILYRLEDDAKRFSIIQISESFLQILLVLLLVIHLKMGGIGKIYSATGGYVLFVAINLYLLNKRHYITINIDKGAILELLKFGIPLLPHSLSFWIKSGVDKILITSYCGLTANGLYSMAISFGAIYTLFNNAFMMAFIPYLQKRIYKVDESNKRTEKQAFVKLSYFIGTVFFMFSIIMMAVCWVLMEIVLSDSYNGAFQFIPWILLSLAINAFYGLVIQFPYTVKKTVGIGVITFTGSCIQLVLTYLLIASIGIDGVKYSLVLGSMIIMLGIWWYSNKVYPLPWFSTMKK